MTGKRDSSQGVRKGVPRLGPALVVEDDPFVALTVADVLREGGADPVETCASTEAAREALERLSPTIIVLDVHLADRLDGWAFAELLPLLGPRQPQLVFATGVPDEIPPEVAALGTVLAKPFAPQAVLTALASQRSSGFMDRLRGTRA